MAAKNLSLFTSKVLRKYRQRQSKPCIGCQQPFFPVSSQLACSLKCHMAARFWQHVHKTESCWLWIGSVTNAGYGHISVKRNKKVLLYLAHRYSYEIHKGIIPEDHEIDHLCRVRHCVNPEHLEAVTHQVNVLRGQSPSAGHATKTHCPHGHAYTAENTYYGPRGNRFCRICKNIYVTRAHKKKRMK